MPSSIFVIKPSWEIAEEAEEAVACLVICFCCELDGN